MYIELEDAAVLLECQPILWGGGTRGAKIRDREYLALQTYAARACRSIQRPISMKEGLQSAKKCYAL